MSKKTIPGFDRSIIIWLLTGCVLIFLMVALGGLTRLTNSGLSMVEWNLFMGSVPPTSQEDWQILFNKYKQYPEYQSVNFNIDLKEFKAIFYWEYSHRMLGRLIGLVFVLPFLWFLIRRKISKSLLPKLAVILFLGAFQGFLGWFMVKSGLVKNPDVSHYRLAMHLLTAFITFAYTLWVALGIIYSTRKRDKTLENVDKIRRNLIILLALVLIQIIWGAYVAGLNGGKIYNTWPLMGEGIIPDAATAIQPWWKNFVEGLAGVQFIHRYMAYIIVGMILFIVYRVRMISMELSQRRAVKAILIVVLVQFLLGVFTLLYAVPIALGLMHQLGAFLLLGVIIYGLHRFSYQ